MADKKWRNELDLLIEKNLNEIISETKQFDLALSKSKDKSKAQIWLAIALLNNKINKYIIENKKYNKKLSKKELNDILDTLEKF